jgi:hypothetical protein
VGHGIQLAAIDGFYGNSEFGSEVEQLLELFDVRAVAHQDYLEFPLAGVKRGEDGLAAF